MQVYLHFSTLTIVNWYSSSFTVLNQACFQCWNLPCSLFNCPADHGNLLFMTMATVLWLTIGCKKWCVVHPGLVNFRQYLTCMTVTYVVGLPPLNSVVQVLDNQVELIVTCLVWIDVSLPLSGNRIKRATCIVVVWKNFGPKLLWCQGRKNFIWGGGFLSEFLCTWKNHEKKGNTVWLVVQQGQLVVMDRMMMIYCYHY